MGVCIIMEKEISQESLRKRPQSKEDGYFAMQDKLLLEDDRQKKEVEAAKSDRARQKELHYMYCPKCGNKLTEIDIKDVAVDKCNDCCGIWLDQGELEKLAGKDDGFVSNVLKSFFGK